MQETLLGLVEIQVGRMVHISTLKYDSSIFRSIRNESLILIKKNWWMRTCLYTVDYLKEVLLIHHLLPVLRQHQERRITKYVPGIHWGTLPPNTEQLCRVCAH